MRGEKGWVEGWEGKGGGGHERREGVGGGMGRERRRGHERREGVRGGWEAKWGGA